MTWLKGKDVKLGPQWELYVVPLHNTVGDEAYTIAHAALMKGTTWTHRLPFMGHM